ncbi:Somatostatin receptor type 5 [Armadillidium nasatum]|uniref:Somatostatin receptor type 5 n=1 Tax=Armadillidium nasatum TaxID=96803 RepID=A0A5N5SJK2_9CRUS|nr:Somatostatin receptor type 5 [Armadillidium nasatum]
MSSFYDFGTYFNCSPHFDFINDSSMEKINNTCRFDDQIYTETSPSSIHPIVRFSLQLFYGLIFLCGVGGNTLVIYVVANHSKMKTVTNLYILNLAIADLLYLMGLPFLIVTSHVGNWVFGNFMCKMYMVVTSLNQFTSSFFLSIMSADRYIAVCHPINAQKYRTAVISKILALSAWACSSLMIFPVFLYSRTFEVENQIKCNIFWSNTSQYDEQRLFTLYSLILSFVFPLMLIFVFYGLVIQKLRRIKANSSLSGRRRSQRKVTRLVLTLIVVYAVCYFPYWTLQISLFFLPPGQSHPSFVIFLFPVFLLSCPTLIQLLTQYYTHF